MLAQSVEDFSSRSSNVGPTEALREFIRVYYQEVDDGQDFNLFGYQETKNLNPDARRSILDSAARDVAVCEALLRRGVEAGEFKINNPTLVAHDIIVSGHMWAVRQWKWARYRRACLCRGVT